MLDKKALMASAQRKQKRMKWNNKFADADKKRGIEIRDRMNKKRMKFHKGEKVEGSTSRAQVMPDNWRKLPQYQGSSPKKKKAGFGSVGPNYEKSTRILPVGRGVVGPKPSGPSSDSTSRAQVMPKNWRSLPQYQGNNPKEGKGAIALKKQKGRMDAAARFRNKKRMMMNTQTKTRQSL